MLYVIQISTPRKKQPWEKPRYLPKKAFNQLVVEYLGRYTHKIAISNKLNKKALMIKCKFSLQRLPPERKSKSMTLTHDEFIRRFALIYLPKGFAKYLLWFLSSN
jgi:hypothetical protein